MATTTSILDLEGLTSYDTKLKEYIDSKDTAVKAAVSPSVIEMTSSDTEVTISSNTMYVFPEMSSLSISLEPITNEDTINEYNFIFTSPYNNATVLSLPTEVNIGDFEIEDGKIYQISILENLMSYQSWTLPEPAIAVYSADNGSLNFYREKDTPTVGEDYRGGE